MAKKKGRQSNIELLRILMAYGVIVLHYNNRGIGRAMRHAVPGSPNSQYLFLTETLFICAVNVFMLISGFYTYGKHTSSIRRVIRMLVQVSLVRAAFTIGLAAFDHKQLTAVAIGRSFIPFNYFMITYSVVCLIAPYLNIVLEKLTEKALNGMLILFLILFSIWPFLSDWMNLAWDINLNAVNTVTNKGGLGGYTVVNYILLYVIGAYLRRKAIRVRAWCSLLMLLVCGAVIYAGGYRHYIDGHDGLGPFFAYCSPFVIGFAVFLFLLFREIPAGENRIINEIAGGTFMVYLVHRPLIPRIITEIAKSGTTAQLALHQMKWCALLFLLGYALHKVYTLIAKPVYGVIDRHVPEAVIRAEVNTD